MSTYCNPCKRYNCPTHSNSLTERLTKLLEYFEEPEETDMRSYITPEKHKRDSHPNNILPSRGGNFDRHDKALDSIKPMPQSSFLRNDHSFNEAEARHSARTSSAMVLASSNATAIGGNNSNATTTVKLTGGKYKSHELHHFTKINATSFISISAPGDLYSEIAFILWVENKQYSKVSTDRYRIVITMLFDMEEELWHVSAKLIKRPAYMQKEEEDQLCHRLCMTSELRSEIKKMLLFLGISPRQAYRMFRKNILEQFNIAHSEYNFITVECASHPILMKELEKPITATNWNYNNHDYPYNQMGSSSHLRHANPEKYKQAMQGYAHHGYDDMYGCGYGE